ncbi:hypothetical protein DPMN_051486 [Dreissena polymorpha]|uniref:Uncharacterized protein n=1 Tax=Dreissena polymorpha TaxID=45954 RepID=A0A9D4HQB3_DREPO|nr:hypothetical protein DPMN_051486 [Dreissena polymorpha]
MTERFTRFLLQDSRAAAAAASAASFVLTKFHGLPEDRTIHVASRVITRAISSMHDAQQTMEKLRPQKLIMSTLCSVTTIAIWLLTQKCRTDGRKDGQKDRRKDERMEGQRQNNKANIKLLTKFDIIYIQLLTKFGEDRMKFSGQTDRQSDSYIAPITSNGGIMRERTTC